MSRWNRLPTRARTQVSVALCVLLAFAWLSLYVAEQRAIRNKRMSLHELTQRLKRAPSPPAPAFATVAGSADALRGQLADLDTSLATARERIATLESRLVPLDDAIARQKAHLAISRAADAAGMQVERFGLRGAGGASSHTMPATAAGLAHAPGQRPLHDFVARTTYAGVMSFLAALADLEFVAAPVHFSARVRSAHAEPGGRTAAPSHWLEVEMVLAL